MGSAIQSKPKMKTMIIGLDGATFDLILPFIKENKLPTFARLLEKGAWGKLESTIPPITAAAWTSFMTGQNPGNHGIINFTKAGTNGASEEEIVTTKDFAGKTFFDVMSNNGLKVGVITVPITYPPWDINGIMISGYPSPDNDKIYSMSKDVSVNVNEPLNFSAEYYRISSEEQIIKDCLYRDKLRADLMFDLLDRYEFDSFVIVLGGTDRSQHDYWKYHDPQYPGVSDDDRKKFRDAIFRNYKLADEQIAKFLDMYGEETNLFIISDHGAGPHPFNFFNVNLWLKNNGWLKLDAKKALVREALRKIHLAFMPLLIPKNKKSTRLFPKLKQRSTSLGGGSGKVFNWNNTSAFYYPLAYPAGGIMINLKGRQPHGIVKPGCEYDDLVKAIIQSLLEYHDKKTGKKIVEKAYSRQQAYQGPYVQSFPDIVYVLNPNYESGKEILGSVVSPVPKIRLSKKSGLHLMNGIFIAHGPKIKPAQISGAGIIDVAPTVLYASGLRIPSAMDGVILTDIFKEEVLQQHQAEYLSWKGERPTKEVVLETQEHDEMKEKLRSLGYL